MTWLLLRPPIVWHGAAIYSLKTFIFLFTASIMPPYVDAKLPGNDL